MLGVGAGFVDVCEAHPGPRRGTGGDASPITARVGRQ
jgi:hypothetical protein